MAPVPDVENPQLDEPPLQDISLADEKPEVDSPEQADSQSSNKPELEREDALLDLFSITEEEDAGVEVLAGFLEDVETSDLLTAASEISLRLKRTEINNSFSKDVQV
jgi:hypothetical protein